MPPCSSEARKAALGVDPGQLASDTFALEQLLYKLRVVRIVFKRKNPQRVGRAHSFSSRAAAR